MGETPTLVIVVCLFAFCIAQANCRVRTDADGNTKGHYVIEEIRANNTIVREAMTKRGWTENKRSQRWHFDLKWSWFYDEDLDSKACDCFINHFPNFENLGTKSGLLRNLRQLNSQEDIQLNSFVPRTYFINASDSQNSEGNAFIADFKRGEKKSCGDCESSANADTQFCIHDQGSQDGQEKGVQEAQPAIDGSDNIWIVKPADQARGVGIQVSNNLTEINEITSKDAWVVQKYIETALLIQNKKFDIRQFVLVASLNPMIIFVNKDSYLRFTSADYDPSRLFDRFVHLTNHQIQKDSSSFHSSGIDHLQWSLPQFKSFLKETYNVDDMWDNQIFPKIEKLVASSVRSWPAGDHRNHSFELLGLDILLAGKELTPYLLEINTNPGLHKLTPIVIPHHGKAVEDMFDIIIDHREKWRSISANNQTAIDIFNNQISNNNWKLIYVGEKKDIPKRAAQRDPNASKLRRGKITTRKIESPNSTSNTTTTTQKQANTEKKHRPRLNRTRAAKPKQQ